MKYVIDHLAFRTIDRAACVKFFVDALGYIHKEDFEVKFDEEGKDIATCSVLAPDEHSGLDIPSLVSMSNICYVRPSEVFVSQGNKGSIVGDWCDKRDGSGLHHIALRVPEGSTVEEEMEIWKLKGWAEDFTSPQPFKCKNDDMVQIFTKPSKLTGIVFELISRKERGFCRENLLQLFNSTRGD